MCDLKKSELNSYSNFVYTNICSQIKSKQTFDQILTCSSSVIQVDFVSVFDSSFVRRGFFLEIYSFQDWAKVSCSRRVLILRRVECTCAETRLQVPASRFRCRKRAAKISH